MGLGSIASIGRQFSLFSLVGVVGTIAHYLLLLTLVELANVRPVGASMAGALLGALVNYALNYRYTFGSRRLHREALPRFMVVAGVGFALNAAIMWLAVAQVHIYYMLAQVITTAIVLVWNYLGNRLWTFSEKASCRTRCHPSE
jgi:putative flippase GtrA